MPDRHDVEIRIVITEGILSDEEAASLRQEALHTRQSPLALLVKQGRQHLVEPPLLQHAGALADGDAIRGRRWRYGSSERLDLQTRRRRRG